MKKHSEQTVGQIFIFQIFRKQPVRRNVGVCGRDELRTGRGQTGKQHSEKILREQRQSTRFFRIVPRLMMSA